MHGDAVTGGPADSGAELRRADVAVVGAGLAGAATAWQLARRGLAVALLEQATPAHPGGSSHGSARIFRYAYPDPFYAGLVRDAETDWAELADASGLTLLNRCGAVDFGMERRPATLADVLAAVGVEHALLSPQAARERWPGIAFDTEVLWQPTAGVLDADRTVRALVELAQREGAAVRTGLTLTDLAVEAAGFRLESAESGSLRADRVVLAAGGWLPEWLPRLPASLAAGIPPLVVRQEQIFHFPYRSDAFDDSLWPAVIHQTNEMSAYALPGGRDARFRGLKVAEFNGGRILPSASASDGRVDPANRDRLTDYVRQAFPGLEPSPYAEATCLFTSTPTEDFVLDGRDGLTVVSPCSGHGAKFAPLIGRLAADVVLGSPTPAPFAFRAGG